MNGRISMQRSFEKSFEAVYHGDIIYRCRRSFNRDTNVTGRSDSDCSRARYSISVARRKETPVEQRLTNMGLFSTSLRVTECEKMPAWNR